VSKIHLTPAASLNGDGFVRLVRNFGGIPTALRPTREVLTWCYLKAELHPPRLGGVPVTDFSSKGLLLQPQVLKLLLIELLLGPQLLGLLTHSEGGKAERCRTGDASEPRPTAGGRRAKEKRL
jgi:hypothetical protein